MALINWIDQNTAGELWTADKANEIKTAVNGIKTEIGKAQTDISDIYFDVTVMKSAVPAVKGRLRVYQDDVKKFASQNIYTDGKDYKGNPIAISLKDESEDTTRYAITVTHNFGAPNLVIYSFSGALWAMINFVGIEIYRPKENEFSIYVKKLDPNGWVDIFIDYIIIPQ